MPLPMIHVNTPKLEAMTIRFFSTACLAVCALLISGWFHPASAVDPPGSSLFLFPSLIEDTTICQNSAVQLATLNADPDDTQYDWTPADGLDDPNSPTPIATPETTTTYQLIAVSGDGLTRDTARVTITVIPADVEILIDGGADNELCLGESVSLTASLDPDNGLDSLLWSASDNSIADTAVAGITVMPEETTTYFATYTVNGCTVTDPLEVFVDSLPFAGIMADPMKDQYCQGEIVTLLTDPPYEPSDFPNLQIQWIPDFAFESPDTSWNMVINTPVDTTITYVRLLENRGCSGSDSITLEILPPDMAQLVPAFSQICPGESVELEAIYDGEGTLSWSDNSGCAEGETRCLVRPDSSVSVSVEPTGVACPSPASAFIEVTEFIFDLNEGPACLNVPFNLNTVFDTAATYTWSSVPPDPSLEVNNPQPQVLPTQPTTYTLTVSKDGCDTTVSIAIDVIELEVDIRTDTTICRGDAVSLNPGFSPNPAASYTWTSNPVDPNFDANTPNPQVSPVVTTTYQVTVRQGACVVTDQVTITVNPGPSLELVADTILCPGERITLNGLSEPGVMYDWTSDPPDPELDPMAAQPAVAPQETTTYSVFATDGTCDAEGSVTITVVDMPMLTVTNDTVVPYRSQGTEIALEASSGLPPEVPESYRWVINSVLDTLPSTDTLDGNSITEIFRQSGTATLLYDNGCFSETREVEVYVFQVRVPGVFTPGAQSSGPNDPNAENRFFNFVISDPNMEFFAVEEFKVWNRWGQLVYDNDTPDTGWDGTYNGEPCPMDVYVYRIRIRSGDLEFVDSRDVTLVR